MMNRRAQPHRKANCRAKFTALDDSVSIGITQIKLGWKVAEFTLGQVLVPILIDPSQHGKPIDDGTKCDLVRQFATLAGMNRADFEMGTMQFDADRVRFRN